MRRFLSWAVDRVRLFLEKRGEHYLPMIANGSVWVGLAFCTAAGLTVDKWIELRNQAKLNHIPFNLDWLDWAKAMFAQGVACFVAYRNFTDGSWARYREHRKESETAFLRRSADTQNTSP